MNLNDQVRFRRILDESRESIEDTITTYCADQNLKVEKFTQSGTFTGCRIYYPDQSAARYHIAKERQNREKRMGKIQEEQVTATMGELRENVLDNPRYQFKFRELDTLADEVDALWKVNFFSGSYETSDGSIVHPYVGGVQIVLQKGFEDRATAIKMSLNSDDDQAYEIASMLAERMGEQLPEDFPVDIIDGFVSGRHPLFGKLYVENLEAE